MKICLFDHHNNTYPIRGYGGIERVNQLLFQELSNNGYDVTLICVEGSSVNYGLPNSSVISLPFQELENIRYGRVPVTSYFNGDIFQTHTSSSKNCNFNFSGFLGKWIATCHGDMEWAGCRNQAFESKNQYEKHIADGLIDSEIENLFILNECVDSKKLGYREGEHNRIVWIGRICHHKGVDRLIEIANSLQEEILVAGNVHEDNLFNEMLQCKYIKYIGTIETEEDKCDFFSKARISLHTSNFSDPFPLTILEAQHCGIPVMTWANGSMLESNFSNDNVCFSLEEIVEKIRGKSYLQYDHLEIEKYSKSNFSETNLLSNYTSAYRKLLKL